MLTRLSKKIVYDYIRNFCYAPVYNVVKVFIDPTTDLTNLPIQFSSDITYVEGAYVVKNGKLYIAVAKSSGAWDSVSIANIYTGKNIRSGETYLANVDDGDYDPNRFAPVKIKNTLALYELLNVRTENVKMAFDTVAHAREYLRKYTSDADYDIQVEKVSHNKYIATWDDKSMVFYD